MFVSFGSLQIFITEIKANAVETEVIYGDVNGDERVDVFDLCLMKQEIITPDGATIDLTAADVNADGVVDVKDAIEVQDFLLCTTKGFTGMLKKSIGELDRTVVKESVSAKDMPEYCDVQVTGEMASLAETLHTP